MRGKKKTVTFKLHKRFNYSFRIVHKQITMIETHGSMENFITSIEMLN